MQSKCEQRALGQPQERNWTCLGLEFRKVQADLFAVAEGTQGPAVHEVRNLPGSGQEAVSSKVTMSRAENIHQVLAGLGVVGGCGGVVCD